MFVIQQDIQNTSIYTKLGLSGEDRWNTIYRSSDVGEANAELKKLEADKSLDNKRCPLRLTELHPGDLVFSLVRAIPS